MKEEKSNIVKVILLVCLIVAITLAVIKLPALYYKAQDAKEDKHVEDGKYNVELVQTSLSFSDKVELLFADNSIITKDETTLTDEAQKLIISELVSEMDKLSVGYWNKLITSSILDNNRLSVYQVLNSEDGEVNSFNVGVLCFGSDTIKYPSIIIFDLATGKAIYAYIVAMEDKIIMDESAGESQYYIDRYPDCIYRDSQSIESIDKIKEYYGTNEGWASYSWCDVWTYQLNPNNPSKSFSDGIVAIMSDCYSNLQ